MKEKTLELTKMGLVAALYVALGLLFLPLSFGPLQFRFAEMTNAIAVFNKRYVWSVTIGCFIVNMFSSLAAVDLIVGTANTLVITGGSYLISRLIKNYWARLAVVPVVGALSMFMIALELKYIAGAPFWITYAGLMLTEFVMCAAGAIIFGLIERSKSIPTKYKFSN
ncbi:hypothetical protein FC62_GL000430 [Amylolactobacillus amylotrophicus DSM 20534]|uniref:Uncharacterized protein n=4 Tax=Amylolactobacillus TaxID=2767876 RepID=A0A0R1YRV4_9LACO|nr:MULTISPECIES: QueT transporter family protein [Amylolactobacillus]APT18997.1 hypothetical protein LA20533_06945 [Amylolactobacillus amylophilus DSM 20533 = JCM 1125]KRK38740.1 hypothetical protein FC62_GL000430 [Amylolactobacillus amylotrophicus DSM 20534]KRM42617.1 hypothetical protein FD40_GL000409 [Amylolactobacillus amylophilus DSM 20533 = JCM 1125]GED79960.1 membrane protein [Amylolactobacillus amylophilus]